MASRSARTATNRGTGQMVADAPVHSTISVMSVLADPGRQPTQPTQLTESAQSRRRALYALLGDLPPRDRPVDARLIATEGRERYTLEVLSLNLNGIEPVPAYFTQPHTPRVSD